MSTLHVVSWLWGSKYTMVDAYKLFSGIARHLKQPARFLLVTDVRRADFRVGSQRVDLTPIHQVAEVATVTVVVESRVCASPMYRHKGCFARLAMFDPEW